MELTKLQSDVFEAVKNSKPLDFNNSEMNGQAGCTAIGACIALGFSGSNADVYQTLADLVEAGLIKKGFCYTDSIYYV